MLCACNQSGKTAYRRFIVHKLYTLAVNALMLNIDTSLPFRNNPFEEQNLYFDDIFSSVCLRVVSRTRPQQGTNDYSRKLHPLEQFFKGTEYYSTSETSTNNYYKIKKVLWTFIYSARSQCVLRFVDFIHQGTDLLWKYTAIQNSAQPYSKPHNLPNTFLQHWFEPKFLEGHSSAQFSYNPNQTHLIQIIKVFRITRNFHAGVIWS